MGVILFFTESRTATTLKRSFDRQDVVAFVMLMFY